MSDFTAWEGELGPEVTGIGVPMAEQTDAELDAEIARTDNDILALELEELESGKTLDEIVERTRRIDEILGEDDDI